MQHNVKNPSCPQCPHFFPTMGGQYPLQDNSFYYYTRCQSPSYYGYHQTPQASSYTQTSPACPSTNWTGMTSIASPYTGQQQPPSTLPDYATASAAAVGQQEVPVHQSYILNSYLDSNSFTRSNSAISALTSPTSLIFADTPVESLDSYFDHEVSDDCISVHNNGVESDLRNMILEFDSCPSQETPYGDLRPIEFKLLNASAQGTDFVASNASSFSNSAESLLDCATGTSPLQHM